ncbi:hypothetical protein Caci_7458 [Catenulispora acidiphila DSM 44928]|uniref:DUF4062 domain-containing protein n=1 Tax=Catenulispora acidiphila (strain DSM 44928 / JCM 14897 / NBRC 102108 / NRRL B-24433 / ID139908) TaxID=479433 RepID=C7Q9W4_CATAD|nr:DUF4062 domain-containing protein [Catenulispora acidiphila]ACU76283.1 hypothetical protein Caci_7458 [Catenulispora acidiphila DSM 44928]
MKIFISSARKGLEKERDSLPGLITALGHTPVHFEDFSAQSTPSREACLAALDSADVCLLLLGPNYGHIFPETGQSATHDEWIHAQVKGIPRLVFRKAGVKLEPKQHEFAQTVEAYATGVFRTTFEDTPDLQIKIAQALRELGSKPSPLEFKRLTQPLAISWTSAENGANSPLSDRGALLETHVAPVDHSGYSAREMESLINSMQNRVRATHYIQNDVALSLSRSKDHAVVRIEDSDRPAWDKPKAGRLLEVRLYQTGQISIRATLPRDRIGSILDRKALTQQIAEMLRLTGALGIIEQGHVAVAVGVLPEMTTSVDTFDPNHPRSSAQFMRFGQSPDMVRIEPDESVNLTALGVGAGEVAGNLSQALFTQLTM